MGQGKSDFVIFDVCANFEFFEQNSDASEGAPAPSLSQRLFTTRAELLVALDRSGGSLDLRRGTADLLHGQVAGCAWTTSSSATASQIDFVNLIVEHLARHGEMDSTLLFKAPFTDAASQGPSQLFDPDQTQRPVGVIRSINGSTWGLPQRDGHRDSDGLSLVLSTVIGMTVRTVGVDERRARLARRHRLSPGHRAADAVDAATSMVCLHGTDAATVYLSAWARISDFAVADLDEALYTDRSLVKHLSMRRTLFVFPRHVLPFAQAGASNRVAAAERRRLIKDAEESGLHRDGGRWLDEVGAQVLDALSDGREATSTELRAEIPLLGGSMDYGIGKPWGGKVSFAPRVLTVLSASGRVMRASNNGSWRVSRHNWASTESWLGIGIEPCDEASGLRTLVEMWLRAFGPGTETDIKWWLGSTLKAVRAALAELNAVEVDLDGRTGYLLPGDLEPAAPVEPWGALLPTLDPTTMGWFDRDWYLGPYRQQLFDTAGNAGPTAWWDGRIVGTWWQDDSGAVSLHLLEDIGADGTEVLEQEAARLGAWVAVVRVMAKFPTPLAKELAGRG